MKLPFKTGVFAIFCMICLSVSVLAQSSFASKGKVDPEQRAERRTKMMVEKLRLSKEQKEAVHPINLETAYQAQAIKSNEELSGKEKKSAIKSLRAEYEGHLEGILTPEQMEKFISIRQNHKKGKSQKPRLKK